MLELDTVEREMMRGEHGLACQKALQILAAYGEAVGADRFIEIQGAHIDGCLYHGPSTIDFVRMFVDLGGRVRVPTTLNVAAVDTVHPSYHCGPPDYIPAQETTNELHEALGCIPTLTCAPYQRLFRPEFGEHVAWAESNAVVFANSVLGARTDRYGDFTDLCAAIVGRVPYAGFHRDENRVPRVIFDIAASDLPKDLYFAALGYLVGDKAAGRVPWLRGIEADVTEDSIKALGAAAASSGAVALFHAEGVTPEAALWSGHAVEAAAEDRLKIDRSSLEAAIELLCPLTEDEPVAAMCLGTPHFSMREFAQLATAVDGRAAASSVDVFVSTSREIADELAEGLFWPALDGFGIKIVVDTCTYLAPVVAKPGAIVTNSGKYAHYGPGNLQRRVGLMSLERCVRCAEAGRVVR